MHLYLFIFFGLICCTAQTIVQIAQGMIRGVARDGYVTYSGIPYANITSPAGRQKRAGLAPSWSGVRDSRECHCFPSSRIEDCLQLEVHVPASTSAPWPVLVWITGGSGEYHVGSLVQQGIIVVVVYHRLGPIGFLCSGEDKIPGNAGVKDVVLALRWVRDNIVAFRGNPDLVVVAGQGFGAAMAEALTLSPMAHDLYHGMILQSGTVLASWAFYYDSKYRAMSLEKVLNSLVDASVEDLAAKTEDLELPYFPFGMCAEKAFKNEERFLTDPPFDLIQDKKGRAVPTIIGYNSEEAYIFASNLKQANMVKRAKKDMATLIPKELKLTEMETKQVVRQIKDMYFKNMTMDAVLNYHRDAYFLSFIHRSARLHGSADPPVFYYRFSYAGDLGVVPEEGVEKTGAAHADELSYLFSERKPGGDDEVVRKNMVRMWTNFVKYLNPTPGGDPQWEALDPGRPRLLDITTELVMTDFPYERAAQMWDDIYDKYHYTRNRNNV